MKRIIRKLLVTVGLLMGLVASTAYGAEISIPESNADHGSTLEEVLYGISNEEHEYAAVFYGEQKMFEVTSYDRSGVNFRAGWSGELAERMIHVHNHPIPAAFSLGDLEMLGRTQLYKVSIVADARNIYALAAPNGWPTQDELRTFFTERFGFRFTTLESGDTCLHMDSEMRDYLVRNGYLAIVSPGSPEVSFTSELIKIYAEHFGLIYRVDALESLEAPATPEESGCTLATECPVL